MTMNDRIEILQNTFDMLDILYNGYKVKQFVSMAKTLKYDKLLIPDDLIDSIESISKLNLFQ